MNIPNYFLKYDYLHDDDNKIAQERGRQRDRCFLSLSLSLVLSLYAVAPSSAERMSPM